MHFLVLAKYNINTDLYISKTPTLHTDNHAVVIANVFP
jgi:hypothetical protein